MCTSIEGSKFSCTVSVHSCDEVAPQSHEVFTHCVLNPALMKKSSIPVGSTAEDGLQLCHCSIRKLNWECSAKGSKEVTKAESDTLWERKREVEERLWDGKQRSMLPMSHRLHPHIRGSPDVTGTRKSNGIGEEGNDWDVVSQTLLQQGGRHAAHCYTESQSFFFPTAIPNSILKVTTQRYICLPLAVVFCWHSDLAAVQEVGFVALQTLSQTHAGHWRQQQPSELL